MIPFCLSAGTSSHVTKMLFELLFLPVTFCGAALGSDIESAIVFHSAYTLIILYNNAQGANWYVFAPKHPKRRLGITEFNMTTRSLKRSIKITLITQESSVSNNSPKTVKTLNK